MIIKETKKYSLYKGSLQAEGLFNLTEKETDKITYWFDSDEANKLTKASDEDFDKLAGEFTYYD